MNNQICAICNKKIRFLQREFYGSIYATDEFPVVHLKCDFKNSENNYSQTIKSASLEVGK